MANRIRSKRRKVTYSEVHNEDNTGQISELTWAGVYC